MTNIEDEAARKGGTMIPEEAIEAAARALDPRTMGSGGALAEKFKEQARAEARAALEEAAPYMAAQVLQDVAELIEPFSGVGLANGASRGDIAAWLRSRSALVLEAASRHNETPPAG